MYGGLVLTMLIVQAMMLSRALSADVSQCYGDIQQKVDEEHARNQVLVSERDLLSEKVKALEAQVAGLESERATLREEVKNHQSARASLAEEVKNHQSARASLEEDIRTERELTSAIGVSTWNVMESLEDALSQLGAVPPSRQHRPAEVDITLERLRQGCEFCVPAARAYGDHCAKAAWSTTLASLDKAGCAHMDALGAGSIGVATAEEVCAAQRRIRKASKVLQQEFWAKRGHAAATESFKAVQAQMAKGKSPAEDLEASKRGSTRLDKV